MRIAVMIRYYLYDYLILSCLRNPTGQPINHAKAFSGSVPLCVLLFQFMHIMQHTTRDAYYQNFEFTPGLVFDSAGNINDDALS